MVPEGGDARATLRRLERATATIIRRHRATVTEVSDELVRRMVLAGVEVQRIVSAGRFQSRDGPRWPSSDCTGDCTRTGG